MEDILEEYVEDKVKEYVEDIMEEYVENSEGLSVGVCG